MIHPKYFEPASQRLEVITSLIQSLLKSLSILDPLVSERGGKCLVGKGCEEDRNQEGTPFSASGVTIRNGQVQH